jgi:PAS domain S-box-containing protein
MSTLSFWLTSGIFQLCLVLTLSIGLGFLSTRTLKHSLERAFFGLTALVSLWNLVSVVEQLPMQDSDKLFLFRLSSPLWIFTGFFLFEFFRHLSSMPRTWFSSFLLTLSILISLLSIFTPLVERQVVCGTYGYYATSGPFQVPILVSLVVIPFLLGLWLIKKRLPLASPEEQRPLRIVLWTSPIIFLMPTIHSGILPLMGITDLTKVGTTGFSIMVAIYYFVALARGDDSLTVSQAAGSLFQELKDGVLLLDLNGRIEQANPAALRLIGQPWIKIEGQPIEKHLPQFRLSQWYQDYPFQIEKEGKSSCFNLTSVMQKNKGIPYGKLLILRDTSEFINLQQELSLRPEQPGHQALEQTLALKEAQEHIRARAQQLQSLLDNLPFQIFVKDNQGRYILQNQLDRERRGNLLGHELENADLSPERIAEALKADAKVLQGGTYESEFETEEQGRMIRLRSIKKPILNDEGQIKGILGILIDITDVHRLEQERMEFKERLLRSHKMEAIGTLAGGIAHDFNNILGSLTGYCELATETIPEDSPAQKYLREVLVAAERGRQLVQQILTFSRQEEKERKSVAVFFTVRETLNLLQGSTPANIQIKLEAPQQESFILGDPVELHRIIMNLCTNAVHAMKEKGGELTVFCEDMVTNQPSMVRNIQLPAGHWVCVEIRDTGHGIPEEKISRIFDPFFTTKKTSEGTGLGLSVVLGILQAWNAHVSVSSVKDQGTCFRIFLPALVRRQRTNDSDPGNELSILLQTQDPVIISQLKAAVGDQSVNWMHLRQVDDIPRLWRASPWKLGVLSQNELDLPYELLIQQWRAQGLVSPFIIFSSAQPNDQDLLDRVVVLPLDATVAQISTAMKKFLWQMS